MVENFRNFCLCPVCFEIDSQFTFSQEKESIIDHQNVAEVPFQNMPTYGKYFKFRLDSGNLALKKLVNVVSFKNWNSSVSFSRSRVNFIPFPSLQSKRFKPPEIFSAFPYDEVT